MGYRLHPKHSSTPALHESAVDEVEALQLRQGMEAGMASGEAATEDLFGENSFSDLLIQDEDMTTHGNAETSGFGFSDNGIWRPEECEPERDSTMPATPSDLDLDGQQVAGPGDSALLRHELGTSSASLGSQQSGPPETFSNVNLDACVATASMSLPAWAPKPIWDEGIWSIIFGDGILLKSDFCCVEYYKPKPSTCLDSWIEQIAECRCELKRSLPESVSDSFADVVRHVPEVTWQEERESMLQSALKRWLVVVISFNRSATVWQQLATESEDVGKISVLSDLFRGKAPATLLKRVRAVEKLCQFLGVGCFPAEEASIYKFFQHERYAGAPPSRLRSYLEAIAFCYHVFSMAELQEAVTSKRLHGCTIAEIPGGVTQASPLTVDELCRLHTILHERCDWTAVFVGAVLFVTYSRARWADAMHSCSFLSDKDEQGVTRYLEASSAVHKTMHAAMYKHRMLPLVAPAIGVVQRPWADRWLQVRKSLGIAEPPDHPLMPAPSAHGAPTMRPLSASEAGGWLRKILFGRKEPLPDRRVSAHSMKATMLSFAAKFGLDAETRLQLAYHVGGFKLLHTYSRDAAAQPLLQLEKVLKAIHEETFRPDSTRSGRFACQPVEKEPELSSFTVVDLTDEVELTEVKQEETQISDEAASSSSAESEETFPKSQGRLFRPPTPPDGYVFWQHRKLRTLHLALPEYRRVFMCNRMIGPLHTRENMVIRYDTPVCRHCAHAVREWK